MWSIVHWPRQTSPAWWNRQAYTKLMENALMGWSWFPGQMGDSWCVMPHVWTLCGPFHMHTVNRFSAFTGATYPVLIPVYIALTPFQTWIKNPLRSRIWQRFRGVNPNSRWENLAERGKFWSVAETKLLLDTWSPDHILEQLRAAVRTMLRLERSLKF